MWGYFLLIDKRGEILLKQIISIVDLVTLFLIFKVVPVRLYSFCFMYHAALIAILEANAKF